MRTTIKAWDTLYIKLGQINPRSPLENKIVKQTMKPWEYKKQANTIARRLDVHDSVLEIGCGYGGLALEILKLVLVKYTVVDNELMLIQAKKFLGNKVEYIEASKVDTLQKKKFKLFISHNCLAETPAKYRKYILENIIKNCQEIQIIDLKDGIEPTPKMVEDGYEVIPLNIEKWLKKYFIIKKIKCRHNLITYRGKRRK